MASQLTKAQINKILEHFEDKDFPPFVTVAAGLSGISPDLAEACFENGRKGQGTPLENEFHTKVNAAKARFCYDSLRWINDPYLSKGKEPRARQLMALLGKLEPVIFGGKNRPVSKPDLEGAKRAAELTPADLEQAMSGLEEPEE